MAPTEEGTSVGLSRLSILYVVVLSPSFGFLLRRRGWRDDDGLGFARKARFTQPFGFLQALCGFRSQNLRNGIIGCGGFLLRGQFAGLEEFIFRSGHFETLSLR